MRFVCLASMVSVAIAFACGPAPSPAPPPAPPPAPTGTPTPSEEAPPLEEPPPPPPPSPEVFERAMVAMDKLANLIATNASNCDKMATAVLAFTNENAPAFLEAREGRKTLSFEERETLDAKYRIRVEANVKRIVTGGKACANEPRLKTAFDRVPLFAPAPAR